MNTAPSLKRLAQACNGDVALATSIREAWLTPWPRFDITKYPATEKWTDSCYHSPGSYAIRRSAVDELFGTFGIEYLGQHKRQGGSVHYCNAGDTYTETILFHGSRMFLGCWGDLVEHNTVKISETV